MVGERFERLVVLSDAGCRGSHRYWLCQCDCGNVSTTAQAKLRSGHTKSCGCLRRENSPGFKHGLYFTKTCKVWRGMISRCYHQNHTSYPRYGGAGVTVCPRWRESFLNFLEDMGEVPEGLTLERVGGAKVYCKENCTWATPREQALSRRTTRWYTFQGETLCLKDWAQKVGIPYLRLYKRVVYRGWSLERALTTGHDE